MGFNELNSVESYIIHQLSGVNLNHAHWQEEKTPYGFQWSYKSPMGLLQGTQRLDDDITNWGIYPVTNIIVTYKFLSLIGSSSSQLNVR